uniref:Uncharacterized protein n=1 Tax=Piliocolobus tephrosceles TaxID=591936 RepID=A0A8C9IDB7_9PRIM
LAGQKIHLGWANREYIGVITSIVKYIEDSLNLFSTPCHSRLTALKEELIALERRPGYDEAQVTKCEMLT